MRRLSASAVKSAIRPGRLGDGDGLYLVINPGGAKSWACRVQRHGNRRDFGLGSASKVSLAVARERAREVRAWVELGLDPVFERRKILGFPTFREAAAKVLAASNMSWRNAKHEGQWVSTMEAYLSQSNIRKQMLQRSNRLNSRHRHNDQVIVSSLHLPDS